MSKDWLIGGAVFLGALLIASIAVALLEKEETLAEGTPELAVQRFLQAVEADELEQSYDFLSEKLKHDCTVEELFGRFAPSKGTVEDSRITLEKTATVNETVFVTVRVTSFHGSSLFGTSESSFEPTFALSKEEGQWRFTEYPWPFSRCGPFEPMTEEPRVREPLEPLSEPEPSP